MAFLRTLVLLAASCLLVASSEAQTWVPGVATFTGEDVKATSAPNGACGFGPLSAAQVPGLNLAGVSFNTSIFSKYALKGCGACLEVRCVDEGCSNPKDILTVQLFDDCDQCEANQVNLLATPFSRMANIDVGRVKIQYREVPCAFAGGVVTRVDSYRASGGGWVRLVFKNVNGVPLEKVELAKSGTDAWRPMRNAFGAAWEASRLPTLPWDIRLTNAAGKTLVLPKAVADEKTGDFPAAKNF
jgi:expansin (peptidoglycan-binding protein)